MSAPDAPRVLVVGAGPAGAGVAHVLGARADLAEKSRGAGGRAATRRRDGFVYDFGANHVTRTDPAVEPLLAGIDGLVRVEGAVVLHDADGRLTPGDPARGDAAWTHRDGLNRVVQHVVRASGAALLPGTRVAALRHDGRAWWAAADGADAPLGPYAAVVLTAPAPQAAEIVRASAFDGGLRDALAEALAAVPYRPQFALVYAFDGPFPAPPGTAAFLNPDGRHPVAWAQIEAAKPGHVPDGAGLVVAQMSPAWTRAHYDDAPEDVLAAGLAALATLADGPLPPVRFTDHQRWRYALPDGALDPSAARAAEALGLFAAGDGVEGKGRVERALASGLAVGTRVATFVGT